jgi:hypothetical protein
MRADYDSKGDTIQIEIVAADRLDRDDSSVSGVIVGISGEKPALIDLIGTSPGVDDRLRAVAKRHGLDADALIAAAHAALAAPDRTVTVDVAVRAAA